MNCSPDFLFSELLKMSPHWTLFTLSITISVLGLARCNPIEGKRGQGDENLPSWAKRLAEQIKEAVKEGKIT